MPSPTPPVRPEFLAGYTPEPDFAVKLGCSHRTMIRRRLRGDVPPYVKLHDRIWYRDDAVPEWLKSLERRSRGRRAA
jgi:hypothetical protein